MADIIQKALKAKRESKHVEFKQGFDPDSPGEWCELIKDLVAIANSGGGIIVFGLDSLGTPTRVPLTALARVDPADVGNRISKYTGSVQLEFEVRELKRQGQVLPAFLIQAVSVPLVFERPGTYDIGGGNQRTAFSKGTVYFRHGAKSEPGTSEDIRRAIERQLEFIRKSWVKGVRKVVQAPRGSRIVTIDPLPRTSPFVSASSLATTVRAVNDPKATPVLLTRDPLKASGSFIHEEISNGIFDEINNVVDLNKLLAKGQQRFFLGEPVYYRVYAERQHVQPREDYLALLFRTAVLDLYGPTLFWALALPEKLVGQVVAELYLEPKSRHIHFLMRLAVLLGPDFCDWLYERFKSKWARVTQPPSFYFTFKELKSQVADGDPRIVAARVAAGTRFQVGSDAVSAADLVKNPQLAASLLSKACICVFEGDKSMKAVARNLDYFAYGLEMRNRAPSIRRAITKTIGDRRPGELAAAVGEEE